MTPNLIEAMARAIANNVRLEWHGHDHAGINPRSVTVAANAILTAISESGYAVVEKRDDVQCEPMPAIDDDGWCEWIHPLPGYLMQCCDCGLVHEMQYAITPSHENCGDGELNEGETPEGVIIFRARRQPQSQGGATS